MPNDKNHLYSQADVNFDSKKSTKVNSQQQYSRYSVTDTNSIIDIANRSQNPALQDLTKPQIGNPYNNDYPLLDVIQTTFIAFDVYGSEYSIFTVAVDQAFGPFSIPQGRFVEFTIDITVADTVTTPIDITFPNVLNPPILPGEANDHYILKFVAVNVADDTGATFGGTTTIEYIGGSIGSAGGTISTASLGLTSNLTSGDVPATNDPMPFDSAEFDNFGSGIVDETTTQPGVIRLRGGVFQLNSSVSITGSNDDLITRWEQSDTISFTAGPTTFLIGKSANSVNSNSPSNAQITTAFVDATASDVFVRLLVTFNNSVTTIEALGTWGQIFSLGGGTSTGGGGDASQWATFVAVDDVNMATFDLFNIDNLVFTTGTGSLLDAEVGFTSIATGGLRANILNGAVFRWTEESITLMQLSESSSKTRLDLTGVLSSEINLFETTTNKAGTILQGTTTLQYSTTGTQHEFIVGTESVAKITDQGIIMQGTNFIKTPQIGFSQLGNIIQDDTNGMIFDVIPTDDFTWRNGVTSGDIFATLDIDGLFLNKLFIQFTSIASPGVTGSTNVGELFMDTNNLNHLSIIRNASVIDLEVGGSAASFPLRPPVSDIGLTSSNVSFDLALTTGHVLKLIAEDDFEIEFTGFPTSDNIQQEWEVELTQDNTGGRIVTFASDAGTIVNPPVLNTTPNLTTIIVFRTNDQGVTVRVGNTVTTGAGTLFALLIDTNKDWEGQGINNFGALTGVTGIDLDDLVGTATIQGIGILQFFQSGQFIRNKADANGGLLYDVNDNQAHFFRAGATPVEIARFEEDVSISGTYRLDMLKHSIVNAEDIKFDLTTTAFGVDDDEAGIGADGSLSDLFYNIPTSAWQHIFTVNGTPKVTIGVSSTSLASGYRLILNPTTINAGLRLGTVAGDPSTLATSDMWFDSAANVFKGRTSSATVVLGGDINSISQLDSNVTVTDTGSGIVAINVDGETAAQFSVQEARIDVAKIPVFGFSALTFDNDSATSIFTQGNTAFDINFPSGGTTDVLSLNVKFNSVFAFSVDTVKTQIYSIDPNVSPAFLHLFRDDPSPSVDDEVGEVQFRGRDLAATNIVYGKIGVEIEDQIAGTATGSFQWTLRNNGQDQGMMSLLDGVLGISRILPTNAIPGAALVLNRADTGAAIEDRAGTLAFNIDDGSGEINFGRLSVTWDNTTNNDDSSRMDFELLTDDNLQTVFTIRGSAIQDNLVALEVSGESYIKAQSGVIGFFVTDDPDITDDSIIGSQGSMQIPHGSISATTLNDLEAAFGAFDGAMGIDTGLVPRLWIRFSSTLWRGYDSDATITS